MQNRASHVISVFRIVVLSALTVLWITSGALPAAAQNSATSVPASAVEAARKPEFAAKLAHPTRPPARPKPGRVAPGGNGTAYDNGPINGTVDAWTINYGYAVTDSFTLASATTITGFQFGAWAYPSDTPFSVDYSIGTSPFSGTPNTVAVSSAFLYSNQFGYDIDEVTASGLNIALGPGTYWLTLQNAVTTQNNPLYWDENSGPSLAQDSSIGTIPSESFAVLAFDCERQAQPQVTPASLVTLSPSPTQTYKVIYNFTGGQDGSSPSTALTVDAEGNVYGVAPYGGPSGDGTIFKLTPTASGWRFSRLYSFNGANGDGPDSPLVRDDNGRLYGTTSHGGTGSGTLFALSPAGQPLPSVFSNWMESLLYRFTGGSDGALPGGNFVLDSSGNVYGSTGVGGANQGGTLYEFTNGGVQVLHAFPAYRGDGANPLAVVQGADGLYGITLGGGAESSGTFYTTAGGYRVLDNFTSDEGAPVSLAADAAGNFYATTSYTVCFGGGTNVYQLSPPNWIPSELTSFIYSAGVSSWISADASGNLYGATNEAGSYLLGNAFKLTCCWNYTDLHDFSGYPSDGDTPLAPPVVDAHGNIFGTTSSGGAYGQGVVWEISP